MRALLIYPEFPDTFWSFKHALKFIGRKGTSPPLGLLTIAPMLPASWDLRLVDVNVTPLTQEHLQWADYALISAMTVQQDSAREIIARCKAAGLTVVVGGPLFTMMPEEFDDADYLVLNEAEITLPRFLADLASDRAERIYATEGYADIQASPTPMWELADLDAYDGMAMQFSRGCPFACDFCNITALLGRKPRTKTGAQIVEELDALYRLGWRRSVFFVDDNFIGNKKVLKEDVLPALIEWRRDKVGLPFNTEASINLADDEELMEMMVEAGFNKVFIGIETPEDESLAECRKNQNRGRDLLADVKKLQRHGLRVQGGFIVGFDHDTPSVFQKQIEFIQQSGIVTAMVGLLQAPPGTELYRRLKEEGRLLGEMMGDNVNMMTNVLPKMGLDTLRDGYRQIMAHIYSPRHYYERVKTFLKEYQPPKVKSPLEWEHIVAFVRSIYKLGIVDQGRRHYWRLLLWTLFRRPALLPMAVT
ncbi:MAG: B12-binding domain-containing radical SAM protein, partial [Anaerolineae bacterium]